MSSYAGHVVCVAVGAGAMAAWNAGSAAYRRINQNRLQTLIKLRDDVRSELEAALKQGVIRDDDIGRSQRLFTIASDNLDTFWLEDRARSPAERRQFAEEDEKLLREIEAGIHSVQDIVIASTRASRADRFSSQTVSQIPEARRSLKIGLQMLFGEYGRKIAGGRLPWSVADIEGADNIV